MQRICVLYEGLHYGEIDDEIKFAKLPMTVFFAKSAQWFLGVTSGYDGRYLATQNCFLLNLLTSSVF